MRALIFVLTLLLSPVGALAAPIADPDAFVRQVYEGMAGDAGFNPPDDIYTPRLDALWRGMERDAGDEVGRVDFEVWANAQDGRISDVSVRGQAVDGRPDRRIVIARFRNEDRPERLVFYFEKTGAGWKVDDIVSTGGQGPWTLSVLLKYGWVEGE